MRSYSWNLSKRSLATLLETFSGRNCGSFTSLHDKLIAESHTTKWLHLNKCKFPTVQVCHNTCDSQLANRFRTSTASTWVPKTKMFGDYNCSTGRYYPGMLYEWMFKLTPWSLFCSILNDQDPPWLQNRDVYIFPGFQVAQCKMLLLHAMVVNVKDLHKEVARNQPWCHCRMLMAHHVPAKQEFYLLLKGCTLDSWPFCLQATTLINLLFRRKCLSYQAVLTGTIWVNNRPEDDRLSANMYYTLLHAKWA